MREVTERGLQPRPGESVRLGNLAGARSGPGADVRRLMEQRDTGGGSAPPSLVLEGDRGLPAVRGGPAADRRQLRLSRRRGPRRRRRERVEEVDPPRDRERVRRPRHGVGQDRPGSRYAGDSPARARKLGLAMAYQDTSLMPEPVKNNLFLAVPEDTRPPFWRRKRWARKVLAGFDLDLELFPERPSGLPVLSDRQLFEVAKALWNDEGAVARRGRPPPWGRTRWRRCTARSPRAGVAASASST